VTLPPYRVLVTGSRYWRDRDVVRERLAKLPRTTIIVHGAARGLDTIAYEVARELGFDDEPHPADWARHGKGAGVIRNGEMVALGAHLCLAFPTGTSIGTWDCVRRAQAAGITVEIIGEPARPR
jgi:hypothetical protein